MGFVRRVATPPFHLYQVGRRTSYGNVIVLCPCIFLKMSPNGSADPSIFEIGRTLILLAVLYYPGERSGMNPQKTFT